MHLITDKPYRFYFHYYKQKKCMSFHYRGKCYQTKDIYCYVPTETKWNKRQPYVVMQGKTSELIISDNQYNNFNMKDYRIPTLPRIGSSAKKLYNLEARRNNIIKKCAEEQGQVLDFTEEQFWTHSLPEQLATTLESFDNNAAIAAVLGYLEHTKATKPLTYSTWEERIKKVLSD